MYKQENGHCRDGHENGNTKNELITPLSQKIKDVFKVFDEAFAEYKLNEIFLSFNGGKDCTVLLDLLKRYLNQTQHLKDANIRVIYIQPNEPFDEVETFVASCKEFYNIEINLHRGNLKKILEQICCENLDLKAVIIGCRRTDPHCFDLHIFQVYIQPNEPFDEVETFVASCKEFYNIEINLHRGNLKKILEQICCENLDLKAVIIGCRRTDPHCFDLHIFQKSDPDWPPLLRINPLLDWTYQEIWDYIKLYHVPYCSLYDEGYTSLGNKTNTKKNPHLKVEDCETGSVTYKPASELLDGSLERAGRV